MKKKIILILSSLMCVGLLSGCESDNTTTTHIKGKIISIETCRYIKRKIVETNDNQRFYINDDFDGSSTSEDFKLCIIGDSIECDVHKGNYTDENFKILN